MDGQAVFRPSGDSGKEANLNETAALSTTLLRGLEVLQCFTSADMALSNAEIARRLNINRPTVTRLCKTLVHVGYLRRDDKGQFCLAPNLLSLVYPLLSAMPWRHQVTDTMAEVGRLTGGSITLSVMSGDHFVQIKTVGQNDSYPHVPEVGLNGPLLRSSTGRALLSLLDEPDYQAKMAELEALNPEEFAETAAKTKQSVQQCRSEGFCVAYGEWRPNIVAAATPLGRSEDGLLVAMACGMPSFRVVDDQFETDIGPRLVKVANALRGNGLFRLH